MKKPNNRRSFLGKLGLGLGSLMAIPLFSVSRDKTNDKMKESAPTNPLLESKEMGFQWETSDPFLFCVHHEDHFPKGNGKMGPAPEYLNGRSLGDDFIIKDGFRMYHGKQIPGFPGHPHRGFETVTVVREGLVDHADSLGAAGRYGHGDVQWMTAGQGVQHSEMFPLLHDDKDNPMELFQIWLNLPARNKMVKPHFKMLWDDTIPRYNHTDSKGLKTRIEIIAGEIEGQKAPTPPPDSWAADTHNHVAIWVIKMDAGAEWTLPPAMPGVNRTLYFYGGEQLIVAGNFIKPYHTAKLQANQAVLMQNPGGQARILMLQGRPIQEPVIQYGPFVMNTKDEIHKAFDDFHKTGFGGWPWPDPAQVHAKSLGRFARHADGKEEFRS